MKELASHYGRWLFFNNQSLAKPNTADICDAFQQSSVQNNIKMNDGSSAIAAANRLKYNDKYLEGYIFTNPT